MQRKWKRRWQRLAKRLMPPVAAGLLFLSAYSPAGANPAGGTVTSGNATIATSGSTMTINQSTNKAVINWQSFSIGRGETVNFIQPGASAVALNRVIGSDASAIYGTLSANGKVYLVNPNGILFAPGSSVNVGGLVASTLNISDSDFLSGRYTFQKDGSAGSVVNQGAITAANEAVFLGPQVKNEGVVAARVAALAAGNKVSLDFAGDRLLNVTVDTGALGGSAVNSGAITVNGGLVVMSAGTKDALFNTVVNNSGIIRAQTVNNVNGVIRLEGNAATNAGTLDASGKAAGQTGGTVKVLGDSVTLAAGSSIDVSGDAGGGTALIGGAWQGGAGEYVATDTTVQSGATVTADALTTGNGGTVVVWSKGKTDFQGHISARGGAIGGDGGNAEVSGKQKLAYYGFADMRAPKGKTGHLLLDPTDFTIAAAGGDMTGATLSDQLSNANVTILSSNGLTGSSGNINVDDAVSWSSDHNLTLTADHDINVRANITAAPPNADVTLTLQAGHDIYIGGNSGLPDPAYNVTIQAAGGHKMNLVLNPGRALSGTGPDTNYYGAVTVFGGSTILTNGGNVTVGGGLDPDTGYAITDGSAYGGFYLQGPGNGYSGAVLNAGGGDVTIHAKSRPSGGGAAITLGNGSSLTTGGSGNIALYGENTQTGTGVDVKGTVQTGQGTLRIDGSANTGSYGVLIDSAANLSGETIIVNGSMTGTADSTYLLGIYIGGGTITGGSGGVSLTGSAPVGAGNAGIYMSGGQITSAGDITITGTGSDEGAGSLGYNNGVWIDSGYTSASIQTSGGDITISGTSGTSAGPENQGVMITPGTVTDAPVPLIKNTGSGSIIINGSTSSGSPGVELAAALQTETGPIEIRTLSGDVKLAAGAAISSAADGNAIVIAPASGYNFLNNAGAAALAAANGRWIIYSHDKATTTLGGLTPDGATKGTYAGLAPTSNNMLSGNVVVYENGKMIIIVIDDQNITYGDGKPQFTYTLKKSDTGETVTGALMAESVRDAAGYSVGTGVGSYAITANTLGVEVAAPYAAGDYLLGIESGNLTVSPAPLTVTAANAAKTYGQTISFTGSEFTASGLKNGETIGSVTLNSAGSAATANVSGSPYAITADNATGGTFNAGNYTITYNDGALTITPAALTVTANNVAKTYGQTTTFAGDEFTASGLQNGETIGSVTLNSAGSAATANVTGSPYTITADNATGGTFNAGNYAITYVNGALTISPASLTVTANNVAKTYGQTTTFAGDEFTASGLQNGETIGSVTLNSAGSAATANVSGSPYAITADNATGGTFNAGNYTITYNDGALTITPAALTVTAANAAKTYGQAVTFTGAEFTASGLQNGETIGSVTLNSAGSAATANVSGSPYTITADNATGGTFNAGNYTITYQNGALTITPAALTVTANNAAKTYGQTTTFTGSEFTASGLQNGETIGSVTLDSAGSAATANVSGSPYTITADNATGGTFNAGNYTITYQNGALTIAPAALTVTANNAAKTYGQTTTFTGSEFSASGLQNGETVGAVELSSAGSAATANVSGSPYAITADNATGGTFNAGNYAITYVNGALTISPASLTVTANNAAKTYGQTTTFTGTEFTASGLQNGETIGAVELSSAGSAATANVSGSPYAITAGNATGGTFNAGNYTITYNDGALTISPASLTVTANNAAKTYGQTTAFTGAEFSASGLQNGETIGSVTLDSAGSAATANVTGSPYTITADNATGGTFNAGNYTITYNDGALTIAPAALTVTASNAAKTYGQAVTFTGSEFTTSGLQNGETIGSVTLNSAGSAATANVSGSPYAITANNATGGTFNAGNYTITYQNGALTIAPRPITVTAMADTKPYDGTTLSAAVPTITVGSLAGGDTAIFSQTYDTKNAGPGKTLTPTAAISDGNNGNNYAVTYVTNTSGVIMPRSLTVTATAASKTYDGTTTAEVTYNDNRVAGDSLTINGTAAFLDKDADSGKTVNITGITLGGADKDNYTANPTATAAASITPADLTVTADDASRNTGQANPPFTATYSGLVNGETPASLSGSLIFDTTATSSSPAGSYAITLTGTLDARNYSIRYVDGVLTVQSVTNPAYTGAVGTAGQTASGGITGNGFGPNGYWGRGSGFGGGAGGIFGPLYTIAGSGINLTGLGLPGQNQQ